MKNPERCAAVVLAALLSCGAGCASVSQPAEGDDRIVIVEVEGGGRDAAYTYSVIPPVASIRWEPSELDLKVGERAVVRAVALDGSGRVVALLPLGSVGGMSGALASSREAQLRVTVR